MTFSSQDNPSLCIYLNDAFQFQLFSFFHFCKWEYLLFFVCQQCMNVLFKSYPGSSHIVVGESFYLVHHNTSNEKHEKYFNLYQLRLWLWKKKEEVRSKNKPCRSVEQWDLVSCTMIIPHFFSWGLTFPRLCRYFSTLAGISLIMWNVF